MFLDLLTMNHYVPYGRVEYIVRKRHWPEMGYNTVFTKFRDAKQ